MANGYIGQVNIGELEYKIGSTLYAVLDTSPGLNGSAGTITTSNGTTTFAVPLPGYVATTGVTVHIKFVQQNTIDSNLQLQVGSIDGAHPISNPNGALTWQANSIISFTYDGSNWVMNSSQVSGGSLSNVTFGNIQSNGTLQTNDVTIGEHDKLIITDSSDSHKIARSSLEFSNTISLQDQTTTFLRSDGTWATPSYTTIGSNGAAAYGHTHGNITNDGKSTTNSITGSDVAVTTGHKFLREDGSWEVPAYTTNTDTHVNVTLGTTTKAYLLGVSTIPTSTAQALEAISDTGVYLDTTAGKLTATSFSGFGANLTNLNATNITSGTLSPDYGGTGVSIVAHNTIFAGPSAIDADSSAPTFRTLTSNDIPENLALTGTPTAPTAADGTNTTQIATTQFVQNTLKYADAMIFKGTVDGGTSSTNYTPAADRGHTYKVATAGLINGEAVEVGDILICTTDSTAAANNTNVDTIKTKWVIVQTNIDGAVIGPSSSTANHIATFNGTNGKTIKDSGLTATADETGFTIYGGTTSKSLKIDTSISGILDSTSASAISTNDKLVTERDVYYGLPQINHGHSYTSSTDIYVATSGGTAGQYLSAGGENTAPTWATFSNSTVGLGNVSNNANLNKDTGTKGDLIYWSDTDIPDRLSVGSSTNGQVLTLVSGVPAWADNAASDEKLALTAITTSTTETNYYAIVSSTSSPTNAATRLYNSSIAFSLKKGTSNQTTGSGYSTLILGNTTNKGNAANLTGRIRLYGFSTSYTDIIGAPVTSAQTLTLPSTSGGNLVGTSTTSAVGSDTTPVYIAANGVATAFGYTIAKPTAGSLLYGSSTEAYSSLTAGTTGQVLMMGSTTPAWATISSTNVYNSYTALAELTTTVDNESVTIINTNELSHVYNGVLYLANSLTFGTASAVTSITIPT